MQKSAFPELANRQGPWKGPLRGLLESSLETKQSRFLFPSNDILHFGAFRKVVGRRQSVL